MSTLDENLLWQIRVYIYEHFVATTKPPSVKQTAARFQLNPVQAAAYYTELNQRHAFFLEPGTLDIRIANPFSAVPTSFHVHAQGKSYWANCAWDALGIPAALHCNANIEATFAEDDTPLKLNVRDGHVDSPDVIVHFLVPFDQWYDNMVNT
jgi:hypothetical protein